MDLRFVDILESNAHFRQNFRNGPAATGCAVFNAVSCPVPDQHYGSSGVQYKHARAGQRQFRIFLDDSLQSLATTVIKDTTVTLEAGKNYTALLWGYINPTGAGRPVGAPALQLVFFEETVADPGANVALRVINATTTAVDVRTYTNGAALPGPTTWSNIPGMSISTYVTQAPAEKRFNFQPAGGGANVIAADPMALEGDTATTTVVGGLAKKDTEALPGTRAAGSAVTVILWPPSVAGTRTPTATSPHNFTIINATSVWDRRPPYLP